MELELKHLAAYLPYKLKVSKIHTLYAGNKDGNGIGSINHLLSTKSKNYKPILRPLSDLTKGIEIDGVKFVPAQILCWSNITADIFSKSLNLTTPFNNLFYCDYEKLIEWHFDIFGLINAGLAIDKNTL